MGNDLPNIFIYLAEGLGAHFGPLAWLAGFAMLLGVGLSDGGSLPGTLLLAH